MPFFRSFAVLCLAFWALISGAAFAQGPPSGGTAPATEVPLDGGASLLLASGVAYGLSKLRAARRKPRR